MSHLIAIKGSKDGLRLQFDEAAAWEDVLSDLRGQLTQGATFFSGAHVTVDVGERTLADTQLAELMAMMQEYGLRVETLASTDRQSRDTARTAGVNARPLLRSVAAEREQQGDSIFVHRTVRSGQLVRHQGHVTVLGDVNAGGEIIAGGSVVVWGRLRGTVHAGALGDRNAVICALELVPTQLRIADLIARAPDGKIQRKPEVARVEDEHITVETWEAYRK